MKEQRVQGLYFQRAPVLKRPPQTPLPDPDEDPAWYGEFFLQYPLSDTAVPMHHGHVFKAIAELRVIVNDVARAAYSESGPVTILGAQYLELRERFMRWYESLPVVLGPSKIVWPVQCKMQ